MDNRKSRSGNRKLKKRTKSFTEALKEKYCMDDEPTFDFIIVSPKRKSNATEAELAHLRTVVLNEMDVTRAEIPQAGLTSLCPNVVDLDLANNLLESWHELIAILGDLPRVKYVNLSGNKLRLHSKETLPNTRLSVENLALNSTGSTLDEVVRLSQMMPVLKELHLCGNDYQGLADIDSKISDGAFSSLECMRLNNNGITNWSEVWKLRHLPQLKYLILSGNPIQDIFYKDCDNTSDNSRSNDSKNAADTAHNVTLAGDGRGGLNPAGSDIMDTTADFDSVDADQDDNVFRQDEVEEDIDEDEDVEEEESFDTDFCQGGSSFCEEEDDDDDVDNDLDKIDFSLDDRPVSRFGYHQDPEVVDSDEGSDTEQDLAAGTDHLSEVSQTNTTTGLALTSGNINIPQAVLSGKKVHNTNFNNSRSSHQQRGSPFDDSSSSGSNLTSVDLGFTDPLGVAMLPGVTGTVSDEEDNPGDWPRLAAEQFLYDLIDQLDLGETTATSSSSSTTTPSTLFTSMSSTTTTPSTFITSSASAIRPQSPATTSWFISLNSSEPPPQDADGPTEACTTNSRVRSDSSLPLSSLHNASKDTNQNAATVGVTDADANINKMLAAVGDDTAGSDVEEELFARIYSDDDFIPRSVSMFDDEESYSPPSAPRRLDDIFLSSGPKAKAQRCLFGQPSTPEPTNSAYSATQSSTAQNPTPSERESDSCSDCEAEQHNLITAMRHELSEANASAAAPVRPVSGPGSWLEINPSFSTSVRDSGEGYSITTTKTQGARVVVTGLDPDASENHPGTHNTEGSCVLSSPNLNTPSNSGRGEPCSNTGTHVREDAEDSTSSDSSMEIPSLPFHQLQMLCLSNASVSHWDHLKACTAFPTLTNIRLKNNPLYSSVNSDDRRKLYIASLPKVTVLNGGEVTSTEREKAERFFLRYFMDSPEKPELYHTLVARHGPPVKLVDIDLAAGYQEWATLTFKCEGAAHFTRRLHLVEPVGRLRTLVSQVLGLPKWCFVLHHHPCGPSHPECEREIVELRCEALPMSRFDFAEGDEIIVEVKG